MSSNAEDLREGISTLLSELQNTKVRPWNIFKVIKRTRDILHGIVTILVEILILNKEVSNSIETAVKMDIEIEERINKIWRQIYQKEETNRVLNKSICERLDKIEKLK